VTNRRLEKKLRTAEEARARAEGALNAINIPTHEFMDPPDGGDVTVAEQVSRMWAALTAAREDAARVEWIQRNAISIHSHDVENDATAWIVRYHIEGDDTVTYEAEGSTLREALHRASRDGLHRIVA
jgi:hypothetical protein